MKLQKSHVDLIILDFINDVDHCQYGSIESKPVKDNSESSAQHFFYCLIPKTVLLVCKSHDYVAFLAKIGDHSLS